MLGCLPGKELGELLEFLGTITRRQGDPDKSHLCVRHKLAAAMLTTWGSARLGFCQGAESIYIPSSFKLQ